MKNILVFLLIFVLLSSSICMGDLSSKCGELNYWIKEAEVIVFAQVVEVRSLVPQDKNDPDYGHPAVTYTKIIVEEYIKGKGPAQLTVHTKGGIIGDREHFREDQPIFKVGQRGYFFLNKKWRQDDRKKEAKSYRPVCGIGAFNKDYVLWEIFKDEFGRFLRSRGKQLRE